MRPVGKILDDKSGPNFLIKPNDISTKNHFFEAFGNYEREEVARMLVDFFRDRKKWGGFTREELDSWLKRPFDFTGLDDPKAAYVVERDGKLYVTDVFVAACFTASLRSGR